MLKDSYGNTRFFGIYRGVVVETADPLNRGRIRVKVPQILADYATDWAWPSVSAGVSTPITPSIDDGVWVMFEGGDPSFPVWMGVFSVSLPVTTQGVSAAAIGPKGSTGPTGPTGVAVANSPLYLSGPTGAALYIQDATTSVKGAVQLVDSVSSTSITAAATPAAVKTAYDKITNLDSLSDVTVASASTGETLVYNSSGVWTDSNFPSPNYIINGAFDIWQRGLSNSNTFTNPAAFAFTADRWYQNQDGTGDKTISRQPFAVNEVPVAGDRSNFFYRYSQTTAGTGTTYRDVLIHRVEDVRTLAGKTVTLSFWAKTDSTRNIQTYIGQDFGTGGSPSTIVYKTGSTIAIGAGWSKYSTTVTLDSLSGKTIGTNGNSNLAIIIRTLTNNATQTVDVWGVQLEEGSVATPFRRNSPNPQSELAACLRYYENYTPATGAVFPTGTHSTSTARFMGTFSVEKRANPSISISGGADTLRVSENGTDSQLNSSVCTPASITKRGFAVEYTGTFVVGTVSYVYMGGSATGLIEIDSEI